MYPKIFHKIYGINNRRVRKIVLNVILKIEGGYYYSSTIRSIFETYHKVKIGMYTYGECFVPGMVDPYTEIGKYCSIAKNVRLLNRDHPLEFKSTHAFYFNSKLGFCEEDLINYIPLLIGHDVWIGYGALILPSVKNIGTGAVIGAGAIVTKDIPPYAIAVGNPARIIKYRFPEKDRKHLLSSLWWEVPIDEIKSYINEFQKPYKQSGL